MPDTPQHLVTLFNVSYAAAIATILPDANATRAADGFTLVNHNYPVLKQGLAVHATKSVVLQADRAHLDAVRDVVPPDARPKLVAEMTSNADRGSIIFKIQFDEPITIDPRDAANPDMLVVSVTLRRGNKLGRRDVVTGFPLLLIDKCAHAEWEAHRSSLSTVTSSERIMPGCHGTFALSVVTEPTHAGARERRLTAVFVRTELSDLFADE